VEDALVRGLVALEGISPKGSEELRGVVGSPAQKARAVAADEVVRSRLACRGAGCRVSLQRISGKGGGILWSESFDVPADELDRVSRAVTSQLRRGYPDHRPRPGAAEIAVSGEDLGEFLRLRERFESRRGGSLEEILAGLEALRRRAPRFPDAWLLEAHVLRYRFDRSRDPADLARALDLVEEARRMDPSDPQPLLDRAQIASESGRPAVAEAALRDLDDLIPGDPRLLERRALLLNAQGRPREAIKLLREAADLQPSWKRLYRLAFFEYQQGEIAAARRHLEQSLGRSAGNNLALSLLAQVELSYGDPERAAKLYADLVRRAPGPTEISNLGLAELLAGRYAEAADAFRRVAEQDPKNPLYALNLADASTLAGRAEEGRALYGRVVELIAADPAATGPQFLTAKAQALAHLGRGPEAAAAVQEALRLAPANAQAAYEAALVYSLLGERSSALANAGRALDLGYEPRWFAFPWFDPLRADPGFRDRLARAPRKTPA
jgi:tetratricopeptide (TPR) repeat protein